MNAISRTFFCPDLTSQADAVTVGQALGGLPGIESVEIDPVGHMVFVAVPERDALAIVDWALKDAGFPAEVDQAE